MPIDVDGVPISSWTPVIIRGGVFQIPINFLQSDGSFDNVLSASIIITPNGAAEEDWTQANSLFLNVGTGQYRTNLFEADTSAITWDSGHYRIEIVDSSGFTVPCITEGLIFAHDC